MKKFAKIFVSVVMLFVMAFTFASCVPSSYDKATEKMEKAGYTVVGTTFDKKEDGSVGTFNATKVVLTNTSESGTLTAILYDSSKDAKAAVEKVKNENPDSSVKQKGKWVYFGTEKAIEAFEK